jgi:hypothetical protein
VYDPAYWNADRGDYYDHDVGDVWIKGTPAVAAAVLCLFGLGKEGEQFAAITHRIEVAWGRPGEMDWGRPGELTFRKK